eukprot:TRINITY_DN5117_c0_g1_i1.p1 TRINITY_DN5117_c0_g1~~TRINITY_DN5117_c0_g1_i1.p1  ORF type:complete len:704 (-),score=105.68 TRINITY_DN5117_c0_g1_i1:45-2051(-)
MEQAENERLSQVKAALEARLKLYEEGFTKDFQPLASSLLMYQSNYELEERQRTAVRKVFDLFRTNKTKKGEITEKDFVDLAHCLGVDLSSEDARDAVAQLDLDGNGTLGFDDFFSWWQTSVPEATLGASNINILLLKLKSKSYLRTLSQFLSELNAVDKPDLARKAFKGSLNATAGEFEKVASAASVSYINDAGVAKALRTEMKATENAIIFSISFSLRPDIDEFELGELAGTIGDLLLLLKKHLEFHSHKCQLATERGEKVLRFSVFYDEHANIERHVKPVLRGLDLRSLEGRAECSQAPSDPPAKEGEVAGEFIKARARGKVEIGMQTVEFINEKMHESKSETYRARVNLIAALQGLDVNLDFGNMERAYNKLAKAFRNDTTLFTGIRGFSSLKPLLMPIGTELFNDPSIPAPFKDAYFSAINFLRGMHTIRFIMDNQIITVEGENADIADLLPTRPDLTSWVAPPQAQPPLVAIAPLNVSNDFKIMVLGTAGVGKSATVVQFIQGIFVERYDPTIEDTYRKQIEVAGEFCMLEVYDSAGTQSWGYQHALQGHEAFLVLFSITDRSSFDALEEIYTDITRSHPAKRFTLLAGNKIDLESERVVSVSEAEALAAKWGCQYVESSAKTRENNEVLFISLVERMLEAQGKMREDQDNAPWLLTPPPTSQ